MSDVYTVFLDDALMDVLASLTKAQRRAIRDFVRSLAQNPFQEGDYPETDSVGRTTFCKI